MKSDHAQTIGFPFFELKLFSGSANPALGERIANELKIPPGKIKLKRFADGEIYAKFEENIRGRDVFLIQSTGPPVNDAWMELLIMLDAARRASPARITVVIPYFAYARQDRKAASREPISARLLADLVEAAGAHRVLALDLHSSHIQGFFDIPTDNLTAKKHLLETAKIRELKNYCIVAPDAGASKHAIQLAQELGTQAVIINKFRPEHQKAEVYNLIGDANGKDCVIIDDIVDTAGTVCKAADVLKQNGGKRVIVLATHGLFSGPAIDRIRASGIDHVYVTDSIAQHQPNEKINVTSVAPLLARAIHHTHEHESVHALFE